MSRHIDVLQLAREAAANPGRLELLSRREIVALVGFVLQQNDEPVEDLTETFARFLASSMPASLAAAIALTVKAHDNLKSLRDAAVAHPAPGETHGEMAWAIEEFNKAFSALKTRFEEEFPS